MRTKKAVLYSLILLLGGCLPSLHALYTDETLIFKEELVGKWVADEGEIWKFRRAGDEEYELRISDGEEKAGRFEVHLVELEGMMFLDIFPGSEPLEDMQDFYKLHIVPAHTFMKVDRIDPNLQLRLMDPGEVADMLKDDPNLLKHEELDDLLVLTASTEQLQEFMIKYANAEGVFGEASDLTRLEPLYTDGDIVFDANLIGRWEGKDGEILASEKTRQKTYGLTLTEQDGTEHQFAASLVKRNGKAFMALFSDKAELDPNEPYAYAFHLMPDGFLEIEQAEPKLTLREMDYNELSQMLRDRSYSEKQKTGDSCFEGFRIR
jgi:hypothetical protein